jgi:hypothetical protein
VEPLKDASIVEGIFCVISVYFVQHSLDFEITDFSFDHFGKFRSMKKTFFLNKIINFSKNEI